MSYSIHSEICPQDCPPVCLMHCPCGNVEVLGCPICKCSKLSQVEVVSNMPSLIEFLMSIQFLHFGLPFVIAFWLVSNAICMLLCIKKSLVLHANTMLYEINSRLFPWLLNDLWYCALHGVCDFTVYITQGKFPDIKITMCLYWTMEISELISRLKIWLTITIITDLHHPIKHVNCMWCQATNRQSV